MRGHRFRHWHYLFILIIEASVFITLAAVIWADEYLDVPRWAFGAPSTSPRAIEAAIEMILATILGGVVIFATQRVFGQLIAAEEELALLCASCARVCSERGWIQFEEFISERERLIATHAMCPDCYADVSFEDEEV